MTPLRVFDDIPRTDRRPARADERRFDFLNRSASLCFGHVRELIEDWFSQLPANEQAGMRGALRADNDASASAFWELYLHEGYRRAGFMIDVHPSIPGRPTRPDFLMRRGNEEFYLEAVSVGRDAREIAEERRLSDVERVLSELQIANFALIFTTFGVGSRPLSTRRLRDQLRTWVNGLDPDGVSASLATSEYGGFESLPEFLWEVEGWSLEFHAVPLNEEARGQARSAIGASGPGEAVIVDNQTGIRRVLDSKYKKYGDLDAPLVIAVQSNTEYPTRDYEFEQVLYGASSRRPAESAAGLGHLFDEGFWIDADGWRNEQVPQVIAIADLSPWTVTKSVPRYWTTLQPGVSFPAQPDWIAPMIVENESLPGGSRSAHEHFGLAADWPGLPWPDSCI